MKAIQEMKHRTAMRKANLSCNYKPLRLMQKKPQVQTIPFLHGIVNFYNTHGSFVIRQFYYAVISGRIPSCSFKVKTTKQATNAYSKCKNYCTNLRLWGILPLNAIIDDTELYGTWQYVIPIEEYLEEKVKEYRSNWFNDQDTYVEVWCEKLSLARIIYEVSNPKGVYLSVSGKTPSWSQINSFKERYEAFVRNSKVNALQGLIFWFGDFDPNGLDMDNHIKNALIELGLNSVQVLRISITHLEALKSAKVGVPLKGKKGTKDKYKKKYGINYGVELDALTPTELRKKVLDAISSKVDLKKLEQKKAQDKTEASKMKSYLKQFP